MENLNKSLNGESTEFHIRCPAAASINEMEERRRIPKRSQCQDVEIIPFEKRNCHSTREEFVFVVGIRRISTWIGTFWLQGPVRPTVLLPLTEN